MKNCLDYIINKYKADVIRLLTDDLVGIYLTGSIAFGEFYEGKSDLDCTVIIKSPLDMAKVNALEKIHNSIQHSKILLESQYISFDNTGKAEADTLPFYSFRENELTLGKFNANAVTWYTLKKHGITVAGVPAAELDIATTISDVKSYVKSNVSTYWQYLLDTAREPSSPRRKAALTDRAVEWCVCGITRMYYTLTQDDITSKGGAVEYGLTCLPGWTHRILKEALRIRRGGKTTLYDSRYVRRREMIGYMEYMIGVIGDM